MGRAIGSNVSSSGNITRPSTLNCFAVSGTTAALVVTTATKTMAQVIVAARAARPSDSVNRRATTHAPPPKAISQKSNRSEDARDTPATYVGTSRHSFHVGDIH